MCRWILWIVRGNCVGGYLGDISGAFDRVCAEYLLARLHSLGVGPTYMRLCRSFLAPRRGKVVAGGSSSNTLALINSVFQGTVLGPPLWNVFFADIASVTEDRELFFCG